MNVMHCWPTKWLEAAQHAGFARYKGNGEWEFLNDTMRDLLARFALQILEAEREECAKLCEGKDPHPDEYSPDSEYAEKRTALERTALACAEAIRLRSNSNDTK